MNGNIFVAGHNRHFLLFMYTVFKEKWAWKMKTGFFLLSGFLIMKLFSKLLFTLFSMLANHYRIAAGHETSLMMMFSFLNCSSEDAIVQQYCWHRFSSCTWYFIKQEHLSDAICVINFTQARYAHLSNVVSKIFSVDTRFSQPKRLWSTLELISARCIHKVVFELLNSWN